MSRSARDVARHLFAVALGQGGYFTAKQSREAGYGYPHLDYHVSTGAFERVDHGLYRMASIPPGTAPCDESNQPVIGMLNVASPGAALSTAPASARKSGRSTGKQLRASALSPP